MSRYMIKMNKSKKSNRLIIWNGGGSRKQWHVLDGIFQTHRRDKTWSTILSYPNLKANLDINYMYVQESITHI